MSDIETIAINLGIREVDRLRKQYGAGRATVLLADGSARLAELHWYEATGFGRKEYRIKYFVD